MSGEVVHRIMLTGVTDTDELIDLSLARLIEVDGEDTLIG